MLENKKKSVSDEITCYAAWECICCNCSQDGIRIFWARLKRSGSPKFLAFHNIVSPEIKEEEEENEINQTTEIRSTTNSFVWSKKKKLKRWDECNI